MSFDRRHPKQSASSAARSTETSIAAALVATSGLRGARSSSNRRSCARSRASSSSTKAANAPVRSRSGSRGICCAAYSSRVWVGRYTKPRPARGVVLWVTVVLAAYHARVAVGVALLVALVAVQLARGVSRRAVPTCQYLSELSAVCGRCGSADATRAASNIIVTTRNGERRTGMVPSDPTARGVPKPRSRRAHSAR